MRKIIFEQIVDKAFWGLESKYGFKKIETAYRKRGVTVRFQNLTTEVSLNYEIGEVPWIMIADINNPEKDRTSLDWLLVELGEKKPPTSNEAFLPDKMDNSQLEPVLQQKAEQLLTFGVDFLNGDFTLLPALRKRADDYLAECKKFALKQNE